MNLTILVTEFVTFSLEYIWICPALLLNDYALPAKGLLVESEIRLQPHFMMPC